MHAFLGTIMYKHDVFAITDNGDVWRIWCDEYHPMMQRLMGDEDEYYPAIRLLRAMKDLYR